MSVKCEQPVQVPGMSMFPYNPIWNQHKGPCDSHRILVYQFFAVGPCWKAAFKHLDLTVLIQVPEENSLGKYYPSRSLWNTKEQEEDCLDSS